METIITKWGNSLGVRIPGALAKSVGLKPGAIVEVKASKGQIIIMPVKYNLQTLLAEITPENLHGEASTGLAQGREEW